MGIVLTVIVVAVCALIAIKVMSKAVEAARLMDAEARRQIKTAVLVNFGGPCATLFTNEPNRHQRRSL